MTMSIEFVEPPAPTPWRQSTSHWRNVSAALRQKPGAWALVYATQVEGTARTYANKIRKGLMPGLGGARGEFESVSRSDRQGNYIVYARYIGTEKLP